ncbi:MAG: hypothetical protein ACREFK_06650 [Stellaceae bacterium]
MSSGYEPGRGPATPGDVVVRPGALRRISWGGVFAGLFLVLAIQFLLDVLSIGVGFGLIRPGQGGMPNAGSLGIGAAVWWAVAYWIALVIGGFAAARLAGVASRFDGLLHGLVTWALALVVALALLMSAASGAIGGAFGVVGSVISGVGQTVKTVVPEATKATGIAPGQIQKQSKELLQPTDPSKMNNEEAAAQIATDVGTYMKGGSGAQAARNRIIGIMAAKLGTSKDDAAKRFDQWVAQFKKAKSQVVAGAENAAGVAAGALSQAAIGAFVALLLGAIFGSLGGAWGTRPRVAVVETGRRAY